MEEQLSVEDVRKWLSSPVTRLLRRRLDEMRAEIQGGYVSCGNEFEQHRGRELQMMDVKELIENGLKESVLE